MLLPTKAARLAPAVKLAPPEAAALRAARLATDMSAPEKPLRQIHMEDQDADRRQEPQPEPVVPPQTPGEHQGIGTPAEYIPGEEAGEAGKETRGN